MSIATDARPQAGTVKPKPCAPNSPYGNRQVEEDLKFCGGLTNPLTGDEPLPWQEYSLCKRVDPDGFTEQAREAKKICGRCEVRGECLEYALANDERFGVWGGLSERELRRFSRRSHAAHNADHAIHAA